MSEGEYHGQGEEAEAFVPKPLFLCTLDGWKLLDRVGVGCCGWHFMGRGWVRGETLNHMLSCAFLKLEHSLSLLGWPYSLLSRKNSPPDSVTLVPHSSFVLWCS